jgi:hypothetical protein
MAYTFLDLAYEALKGATAPLTYQDLWETAKTSGLAAKVKTTGKTPWQSLGAYLYVDVRDNPDSRFVKVGKRPARFFLKERQSEASTDAIEKFEREQAKKPISTPSYKERDLHPLLAHFAYANPGFNRGRSIYTKTIFHENSLKKGYNEWVHPDMVPMVHNFFAVPLVALNSMKPDASRCMVYSSGKRCINEAAE